MHNSHVRGLYSFFMIAIITVTGPDHTGIVSAVTTALAEKNVNILNISQTIMDGYFTMILHGECDDGTNIADLKEHMSGVGDSQKVVIRVQSEAIFTAMHRV
ncbi:ACT domain-containing protein [Corynebacterium glucuronolyticum]|uniref:UPF0237 protein HMPREF0293_1428 n=2 Tax=Corynebacterium glucuronolyticum TaxID=39791 RepID=A0ABM9XPN1_9CORY|nr:ACT domain protein [Corynebacterium glucuronolyticum ATCC 51866]WKD63598.1 hypothetical protein CGLUCO_06730 [Corynebacterium glucuronolyticum DSM 44120]SMB81111.1 ACT domain-containing protein [Corynebacterium glucuronolyticum]